MKKLLSVIIAVFVLSAPTAFGGCDCDGQLSDTSVLNLYGVDPYTLDPALSGDTTSHQYIMQIFSGLVKFDQALQVTGDIAREWEVSDDGLVYTFYLRSNAFFHDGKQVTAGDFKASWERACDPATGSQTAQLYLGDIEGVDKVLSGDLREITGVKVIDEYVLEVVLKEPRSYFLYKLAYPTAFVVDVENAAVADWWQSGINGTGPFVFKEWERGNRLELEKFDRYYGKVADLQRVIYHLWAGTVMDLYETGQIDVAEIGDEYFDKVTDEKNDYFDELITANRPSLMYIGFNCSAEPFNDPVVRKAFAAAVDINRVVELVHRGTAVAANGIVPPGIPGHSEAVQGAIFNPDEAKRLIAESSYGSVENLPAITLTTGGYGGLISTSLQAVVYQWRQNLGIDIIVRQIDPGKFYYNLMTEKDELFYFGWMADYPHPQNFLEVLFSSTSSTNVGQYENSHYDALITAAGRELDPVQSIELYQQAEEILLQDTAMIPISFGVEMILVKPGVRGYNPNAFGVVALNEVRIENR